MSSQSTDGGECVFDIDGFFWNRITNSKTYLAQNENRIQLLTRLLSKMYNRFPMMQTMIMKQLLSLIPHPNASFLVISDFFRLSLSICEQSILLEEKILTKLFEMLCQMDSMCFKGDETFYCMDFCLKQLSGYFSEDRLKEERFVNILLKISESVIMPT